MIQASTMPATVRVASGAGLSWRARNGRSASASVQGDELMRAVYSYLNASIGSTRDARMAGKNPAASATRISATVDVVRTRAS